RIVRHALVERTGERAVRSGHPWTAPDPSPREGTDGALPLERWRALLRPLEPERRRRALLAGVAWTSPLNADVLLDVASSRSDAEAERALDSGWTLWRELAGVALGAVAPRPVLCRAGERTFAYPLPLPGADCEPAPSLLD